MKSRIHSYVRCCQLCISSIFFSLFVENLREVDKGIAKVTDLFNRIYPDGQTAFLFTADHGMTNKGETRTQIDKWQIVTI